MNIKIGLISIGLLCGVGLTQPAAARNIHVCPTCAHTSIQSAVDDAVSDDIIYVAAGRYSENITIQEKALTLIGAGGGSNGTSEVIAAGRGPVFVLGSGISHSMSHLITIQGFTIAHGTHPGGTGVGGGVQVREGAYLHLLSSTVIQSSARMGGGVGVNSLGAPETTIIGCLIDGNVATGTTTSNASGGGVVVLSGSSVSIQESIITRNRAINGGGVSGELGSILNITNTTVSDNVAFSESSGPTEGAGGGLHSRADITIAGSIFVDNAAYGKQGGGGILIDVDGPRLHNIAGTIIARNSVPGGGVGGGIAAYGDNPARRLPLQNVYVVENLGGGGLWSAVTLVLTNTTIKDNVGGDLCNAGTC